MVKNTCAASTMEFTSASASLPLTHNKNKYTASIRLFVSPGAGTDPSPGLVPANYRRALNKRTGKQKCVKDQKKINTYPRDLKEN